MQQINLYTNEFRPQKVVLSLEQIILLPIASMLILIGLTFWLNLGIDQTRQSLSSQEDKRQKMQLKLDDLELKARSQKKDESLVSANRRLSETIAARQKMIDMLDTVVVKDDEGFSNLLISLARQKTDGLWLSSLSLASSGKEMTLKGTTKSASSVPGYLQNLRQEPSFIGRSFTLFELDQDTNYTNRIDFTLRSEIKLSIDADNSVESILSSNIEGMGQR